ncbi:hypothetical protein HELRODRAFT_105121 [Helobdella robusta]|uniref:Cytochrome P450 n=1 Tax=Helobdella robusta TaxID=6412 RepID=T1EDR0_HELRO|nr:hypothetical protein HELRODRAFT_105121 [Helobdella robusta]ESO02968.1 hypothetical protein HELRODRAFT_105121 [Helobdella robusta]
MTPTFSSGKMRKMCNQINSCCRTMCENLKIEAENKQVTNLKSICEAFTMDTTSSVAFGVTLDSHNDPNNVFVSMARKFLNLTIIISGIIIVIIITIIIVIITIIIVVITIIIVIIIIHAHTHTHSHAHTHTHTQKHVDFLQLLLNAHKDTGDDADDDEEDALSDEDLLAQSLLFFLVGFETTSTTLTFFAYNMACYPEEQEKLYKEIVEKIGDEDPSYDSIKPLTYLNMCLNETLRMFPFGLRTDRVAAQDVTINGLFIPKGMLVGIPIYVLHNDPEFWPEPHVFNPERFSPKNWNPNTSDPMRFMPFGAGPRNCVGMRLAKMEVKLAVVHMIRSFKFSATEETERPPVFERFALKTVNPLKIRVVKR